MNVGIIGAGLAGLTAARDLARAGHSVTVYEAAAQAGGLASGFRDEHWEWPLERFYHHLFETDAALRALVDAIGFGDKLFFRKPITAQWWRGRGWALDGVLPILRFPGLPFVDRLRFGLVGAYLKFGTNNWQRLERSTASDWTSRWAGANVYGAIWRPLLEGKFGPYADTVNMAWLWSRLKARSFKLGYFRGGFQAFSDALLADVRRGGVSVHLVTPVQALERTASGGWRIVAAPHRADHDTVLVTGAPALLEKLVPTMPPSYTAQLKKLNSMGAVVMTIALTQPLTGGLYWVNMPKSEFPFLALVEHTNFVEPSHYGGDHLIYCGDYLEPTHEYFRLTQDELLARFIPALKKVNPRFDPAWIRKVWLHRETYAQPVVPVNHARNIPALATPLAGLYWASMSQVYPWDRGTNFAVELGQRVASEMLHYRPHTAPGGER